MKYEEIIPFMRFNEHKILLVDFTEYGYTALNIKEPILELENIRLIRCIKENEFISKEEIDTYYGEMDYFEHLCRYPQIRLVIEHEGEYKVLHLNKVFFTSELQILNIKIGSEDVGVKSWIEQF